MVMHLVAVVMMHRLRVLVNLMKMNMSTTAKMAAPITPALLQEKKATQRRLQALTRKQIAHRLKQTQKKEIQVVHAAHTGLAGRTHQCLHHNSTTPLLLLQHLHDITALQLLDAHHRATCRCCVARRILLCAEGTEWWKKARQKQSESKQQAPLFNEFVDEEVSPISECMLQPGTLPTLPVPEYVHTHDCMACICVAVEASSQGTRWSSMHQQGMLSSTLDRTVSVQAEMSEDEGHSQGGSDDDADEDGDLVQ